MSNYFSTKEQVISAPVPEVTRTYKPVSNSRLIDLTLTSIEQSGFSLDREYYSSAKEGNVSSGRYTIQNVADTEMQLEIMWRNSYDKSLPLIFSIGCRIKVCNNGMMKSHDSHFFRKKHHGNIQEYTPMQITEYIKNAGDMFQLMQQERDFMKEVELTKRTQAELIGRMFVEENFIKSTQLNILKRELESPTHSYGNPMSMWSLYQYTTFAMREIHPSLYVQDHLDAHNFFVQESGIGQPKPTNKMIPVSMYKQLDIIEEIEKIQNQSLIYD